MPTDRCCFLVGSPLVVAYREGKEGTLQTWALDREDIRLEEHFLIHLLNQAEASFHMEISSYFAGTSSDNSAVAAKSRLKLSTVQNEVALTRLAVICTIFNRLQSQY
jgi:CRISPR/Cas system endoribonuclease Cas6 (RAMP superfamily)